MGSTGDLVRALQRALEAAGHKVAVTGVHDLDTGLVVNRFQREHGLKVTGTVGAETLAALDRVLGLPERAGPRRGGAGHAPAFGPRERDEEEAAAGPEGAGADLALEGHPAEAVGAGLVPGRIPRTGNAFIDRIAPGAVAGMSETGVPASVTIAQAIVESGWGESDLALDYHDLFGVQGTGPGGTVYLREKAAGGGVEEVGYRRYNDDAESAADHARLLAGADPYRSAMSQRDHPERFARALTGVYSPDPNYGNTLIRIMSQWDLAKFDRA